MKSIQTVLLIIGLLCLHGCALTDQGERSVTCGPEALQCEYLGNPIGLDVTHPRLSWQLTPITTKARGFRQTAYQILVSSSQNKLIWAIFYIHITNSRTKYVEVGSF